MGNLCFYCSNIYQEKHSEHVFPDGLGGADDRLRCVCKTCNGKFSNFEQELYRNSPLGLLRSIEGITAKKTPHFRPKVLLHYDTTNKIAYEVSQNGKGININIQPQIQYIKGQFYIEGSNQADINLLRLEFKKWKNILTLSSKESNFKFILDNSGKFIFENCSTVTRKAIRINILPQDNEFYNQFTSRLYLDSDRKLNIRATSIENALIFLQNFLDWTTLNKPINSYGSNSIINGYVSVQQHFNGILAERAVAKIALNCLLHYFSQSIISPAIIPLKLFITDEVDYNYREIGKKNVLIDNTEKSHNIFFYQMIEGLNIRVSLFNGVFVYVIIVPDLQLLKHRDYKRLVIDYVNRKQKLENFSEFIKSFNLN